MITEVYVLVYHRYIIKLVDNTENQIIDDINMPKILKKNQTTVTS